MTFIEELTDHLAQKFVGKFIFFAARWCKGLLYSQGLPGKNGNTRDVQQPDIRSKIGNPGQKN